MDICRPSAPTPLGDLPQPESWGAGKDSVPVTCEAGKFDDTSVTRDFLCGIVWPKEWFMKPSDRSPQSTNERQEPGTTPHHPTGVPGKDVPGDQSAIGLRKSVHDLRNSLNIVRNATYLLRRKLVAAGGGNVDLLDMIDEAVASAESVSAALMEQAVRSGEPPTSGLASDLNSGTCQPNG